jgi:hypothetical protein
MKNIASILLVIIYGALSAQTTLPENYNPVWHTQSSGSSGSMPCGGGDVGLNVWVENNDILFYIARSGTFDENNTMPKLGRVRIKLFPDPLGGGKFRQELDLQRGSITISGKNRDLSTRVEIWVDVFSPVIHVDIQSNRKTSVHAVYENWRFEDRLLQKNESYQNSWKWAPPEGLKTKRDSIDFSGNAVVFYHRNQGETIFDVTVRQQQMEEVKEQMFDPLKNLTYGGIMLGDSFIPAGTIEGKYMDTRFKGWILKSRMPAKKQNLRICLHTGQYGAPDEWNAPLQEVVANSGRNRETARAETINWWKAFWGRSFIFIHPESKNELLPEWQVGRNYQLFRYMLACNAYGTYPTKFNGGLFTFDPVWIDSMRSFTPDFRNWGGGTFTAQNQRLVYFPMFPSGDFELVLPQLDFYRRILPNAELRSRHYWGHDGACFTEQIENFGLPNCSEYGWNRPEGYDPGRMYNAWLEYQWDTSLEFCWMALMLHQYTGADISEYLPLIESCLTFFEAHYETLASKRGSKKRDGNGHLVLYPGSACETYKMAYNATSTIAALETVTRGLICLPDSIIDEEEKTRWIRFLQKIPPLGFRAFEGKKTLAPAWLWERVNNTEVPQLYPVFPWGIYGIGKPGIEVAINTYRLDPDVQQFKDYRSWKQYNIFAARLGMADEAMRLTTLKLQDSEWRFPAFWGPGFDWVPDHNWGGSGMIGLQEMLLQANGDSIYLFPAWPETQDVHFKLHVPQKTSVEAELKEGKVHLIRVEPKARKKDMVIMFHEKTKTGKDRNEIH